MRDQTPAAKTQKIFDPSLQPVDALISHYRIRSLLPSGGMGHVYLAHDEMLKLLVAIKLLPAHLKRVPDAVKRFTREARAVSALNHPNIVTIHDSGECDYGMYI